jgi:hypothetical protein
MQEDNGIVHMEYGWDQDIFHPMWHRVLEEQMFIELVINFLHFMKPEGSFFTLLLLIAQPHP